MIRSEMYLKGNEMRYLELDNETDSETKTEIEKLINLFLDEFMLEEYKGGEHILAREHYYKVFHNLLPRYLKSAESILLESLAQSAAEVILK